MQIKINKIEQLTGKDSGTPYWKLETDKGSMSCFDKEIADELWKAWTTQTICYVDAIPSKDGKYVNIRKRFIGPEENDAFEEANRNYEAVKTGSGMGAGTLILPKPQDLGKTGFDISDSKGKVTRQYFKQEFNPTSMYVSYVKDLVVSGKTKEEAVEIVKQAHQEFS